MDRVETFHAARQIVLRATDCALKSAMRHAKTIHFRAKILQQKKMEPAQPVDQPPLPPPFIQTSKLGGGFEQLIFF